MMDISRWDFPIKTQNDLEKRSSSCLFIQLIEKNKLIFIRGPEFLILRKYESITPVLIEIIAISFDVCVMRWCRN